MIDPRDEEVEGDCDLILDDEDELDEQEILDLYPEWSGSSPTYLNGE